MGGYFGARLAAAGEDVTFIARGAHFDALQTKGLRITSPKGDVHLPKVKVTDRVADIGPVDVVLLTVKLYDVVAAAASLGPLMGPETVVITLQNGVEAVEMVGKHVGNEHVAGGAAYIVAVIDAPGHIRHTVADMLVFGEHNGERSPRLVAFEEAGRRAGFQAKVSEDIVTDLWIKFVRLTTWSGLTTVTRSPMGVIRSDPEMLALMMTALDEAIAVGQARGIQFPDAVIPETAAMIQGFPFDSKSSMLEALERGQRLELPWLSGAVSRLGRESGVPTPAHTFITTGLTPFVQPG